MDRLEAMQTFARVARLRSFSAAARALRRSPAAVSRQVAQLEAHLGVRLLERTTRRLRLTPAGERYLRRAEALLAEVAQLEDEVASAGAGLVGRLRVCAGHAFGRQWIAPLLPAFLARHPRLACELVLADAFVDLVEEGIDVAIRAGRLADSSLQARRLGTSRSILVASPDFLARVGAPGSLADLQDLAAICDTNRRDPVWRFENAGRAVEVRPQVRLAVNDPEVVREAAVAGMGIARVPHFAVAEALATGRLVRLLPELAGETIPVHALAPAHREPAPKTEAFIQHLIRHFRLPADREPPPDRAPA